MTAEGNGKMSSCLSMLANREELRLCRCASAINSFLDVNRCKLTLRIKIWWIVVSGSVILNKYGSVYLFGAKRMHLFWALLLVPTGKYEKLISITPMSGV
jgi:predicted membrane-bound dolichyl-phosphate-mannose-protein mannosyltransferase